MTFHDFIEFVLVIHQPITFFKKELTNQICFLKKIEQAEFMLKFMMLKLIYTILYSVNFFVILLKIMSNFYSRVFVF